MMNNKEWSEKILRKVDPSFKHRWEVYNDLIKNSINSQTVWLDCGCGDNNMVNSFGQYAKTAIGIDLIDAVNKNNFIKAKISNIPLPSNYTDLITLRFVVEHFDNAGENFSELIRILKPNGRIIILTTNLLSPIIFLPRLIFPYRLKSKILEKTFKVKDKDIFPTYHKLNTPRFYSSNPFGLRLKNITFISDLNYTRKIIFLMLLFWHKLTNSNLLRKFRTNILVVLEKS